MEAVLREQRTLSEPNYIVRLSEEIGPGTCVTDLAKSSEITFRYSDVVQFNSIVKLH